MVKLIVRVLLGVLMMPASAALFAQTAPQPKPAPTPALLDKMLGKWVIRGTIEGQQTTHDLEVSWVLNHGYLRLNEVSRERTASGAPQYEAIVLMSWDAQAGEVRCLWLDTTSNSGLSGRGIGIAKPTTDTLPIIITSSPTVSFQNKMVYNASNNSWQWIMDGIENGQTTPFARLILTRK